MSATDEGATRSLEQLAEDYGEEHERAQRELKEIDLLIQQTGEEVERMERRNTQAMNDLRQVEAAIDTVPREDLQEAYTAVLDTQQRLFTMRGQLEKLQSDRHHLSRYVDVLRALLEDADLQEPSESEELQDDAPAQASVVRVIEAQERERRRLSRQMHDGPAQSLTNLILQAEICERLMESDPDRAREELAELKKAVVGTFQKVKGFILNLRPMMLDDLGLVPTLRRYLDSFSETSDMVTDLTVVGKERRLASHTEVTTFRVIQELLSNAREASQATSSRVTLDMRGERLEVVFEDDGAGLEVSDALSSEEAEELGLATMRERIEMLGGELHFEGGMGRRTRVTFDLPMA